MGLAFNPSLFSTLAQRLGGAGGPGADLHSQLQEQLDERKKKLLAAGGTQPPAGVAMGANNPFTPTALGVFGR